VLSACLIEVPFHQKQPHSPCNNKPESFFDLLRATKKITEGSFQSILKPLENILDGKQASFMPFQIAKLKTSRDNCIKDLPASCQCFDHICPLLDFSSSPKQSATYSLISIRIKGSLDKIEKLLFQQEEEVLRKDGYGLHESTKLLQRGVNDYKSNYTKVVLEPTSPDLLT
jgi:hypothetical protein